MKIISLRHIIITACCSIAIASQTYSMEIIQKTIKKFTHDTHEDIRMIEDIIAPNLEQRLYGTQAAIANNPHKNEIAYVEYNPGISDGEKLSIKNRFTIVKAASEKFLNRPINDENVPNIALIFSGGGVRAQVAAIGSLCGATKIGLFNMVTYTTALSGGTWAIAPLIAIDIPIEKYKEYIQDGAAKSFFDLTHEEKLLIADNIAVKKICHQRRTLVDPYGDLLANRLLKFLDKERHITYLSDQAEKVESGEYPYPIFTAADGQENTVAGHIVYEYTPHTVGDRTTNMHIPTWAYGRKFKHGKSTNDVPEKDLGYMMGTWGSAFAANIHTIIKEVEHDKTQKDILPEAIEAKRVLPFWSEIDNYLYKNNSILDKTLTTHKHAKRVDPGLERNLPFEPVSGICKERKPDILIFLDASAGAIGEELLKVAQYAKEHNLPFPHIDTNVLGKETFSVFKDTNNKEAPLVFYMPRISDKELWEKHKDNPKFADYNLSSFDLDHETNNGFCKTQHFTYTREHSTLVMNQTEFNMCVNEDAIKQEIDAWLERK